MEQVKIIGVTDGMLKVELSGDIDLGNADAFYSEVMTAYQAEPASILFDCEKLDFIDSTTLGTFVKILKTLYAEGRKIRLEKLQPKVRKLFFICALDSIMEIA